MSRRSDLEWLRIVLCASVILQHAVLVFAAEPRYHVKSIAPSVWASVVYEGLRIFAMPVFFAIAGWAAVASLRRREAWGFARDRAARLGVPLLAGIFLLGPVIKYIELSQGRDHAGGALSGLREVQDRGESLPLHRNRQAQLWHPRSVEMRRRDRFTP